MQQSELDEMCVGAGSGDEVAPPSPTDTMLKDIKKKKRRITFTALGCEISEMAVGSSSFATDGTGLAQSTLDDLAVAESTLFERDESPIGSELRRKKRSRFSAGGAGAKEMLALASEIADVVKDSSEKRPQVDSAKVRVRDAENLENNRNVSNSPSRRSRKLKDAVDWPKPSALSPGSPLPTTGRRCMSGAKISPLR